MVYLTRLNLPPLQRLHSFKTKHFHVNNSNCFINFNSKSSSLIFFFICRILPRDSLKITTTRKSNPRLQPMPSILWPSGTSKMKNPHRTRGTPSLYVCGPFVLRPSPVLRPGTAEEVHDSEEESEYMVPSSRPILHPITAPPLGEIPAVPRHSQPHSLLTAQTQSTASSLNSRYFRTFEHSVQARRRAKRFSSESIVFRLALTDLEDGPQTYEAMYNIQAGAQQAIDSGILPPCSPSATALTHSCCLCFNNCSDGNQSSLLTSLTEVLKALTSPQGLNPLPTPSTCVLN